ncbi:excitatory amino acid transporter 3-like [Nothobranchius furzeri]|uniref:excitatory amino acid transporter 3-like n=1 Tax=Nothobranchius furzeri TaxID=105023 RepID=UPI00390483D4
MIMVEPAAERKWRAFTSYMKENNLIVASLVAVVLGIVLGVVLKTYVILTDEQQEYIKFPGEILMRMLQFVSVPLITTSVTLGVAGLSISTSRNIALRATIYFIATTLIAVTIGERCKFLTFFMFFSSIIQQGKHVCVYSL